MEHAGFEDATVLHLINARRWHIELLTAPRVQAALPPKDDDLIVLGKECGFKILQRRILHRPPSGTVPLRMRRDT